MDDATRSRIFKTQRQGLKYDRQVEEVHLVRCNPQYAHVVHVDGRQENVSIRRLAPGNNRVSRDTFSVAAVEPPS